MIKNRNRILLVVFVLAFFTIQLSQAYDKDKRNAPEGRSALASRQAPTQIVYRQVPQAQNHFQQSPRQDFQRPRIYAISPVVESVQNNRLLNRQHHNHWQPRYNYYDNQYHFYPYVNIASLVELSGGYTVVGPDGQNYYYDQGTFYLQDQGGQFEAIAPPVGIIVNPIAPNARQIDVGGQMYFRYKGVFYVQVPQGFQVIGPVQSDSGE